MQASVSGLLLQVCMFGKALVSGLLLEECIVVKASVSGLLLEGQFLWTAPLPPTQLPIHHHYGWELHVVRYDQALNNHGVPEQALMWPKL